MATAVTSGVGDAVTNGASQRDYRWYAAGVATWFAAWGMQSVLFSWLVVGELRVSPERVGLAQTSTMLPSLFLILLGGATADRHDPRRLLILLQLTAMLPILLLAGAVASGALSLPLLLLFGISIGTISAFVMPARDALLSRVAGADMMRAVTGMTAVQFGAQALGTLGSGAARWVGSATMLVVQAALVGVGALLTARLPAAPPTDRTAVRRITRRDIVGGLVEVFATPGLRVIVTLVIAVGLVAIGPFIVVFPLLIRDVYHGDVDDLALVLLMFPLGTIAGSLGLRKRGGIRRKGLAMLVALASGGVLLAGIGLGLPFPATIAATFAWGVTAAVFITSSRTVLQNAAPPTHLGRVLSVYQLGFMGAAPVGAFVAGVASARIGPLATLIAFGVVTELLVVVTALASDTARLE